MVWKQLSSFRGFVTLLSVFVSLLEYSTVIAGQGSEYHHQFSKNYALILIRLETFELGPANGWTRTRVIQTFLGMCVTKLNFCYQAKSCLKIYNKSRADVSKIKEDSRSKFT